RWRVWRISPTTSARFGRSRPMHVDLPIGADFRRRGTMTLASVPAPGRWRLPAALFGAVARRDDSAPDPPEGFLQQPLPRRGIVGREVATCSGRADIRPSAR